jgi:hypothetical protein
LEAFFGVLYAGFAGAVIFGKVTRIGSVKRVWWSDPIVVRYGSGVAIEHSYDKKASSSKHSSNDKDDDDEIDEKLHCPILEFRIVNQSYNQEGGEIINSGVTVWASTLAELAAPSIREAANLPSRRT